MTTTAEHAYDAESADALAVDGGIITIRPVRPTDRRVLARLYGDATPDSLRLRFFAMPGSGTLAAEVDRLCQPESDRHLAVPSSRCSSPMPTRDAGSAPCCSSTWPRALVDLNPVLAGPEGVVAVDAKLRLAPVGAEPDPLLRRLGAAESPGRSNDVHS